MGRRFLAVVAPALPCLFISKHAKTPGWHVGTVYHDGSMYVSIDASSYQCPSNAWL